MLLKKTFGITSAIVFSLVITSTAYADQRLIINYSNNASLAKLKKSVKAAGGEIVRTLSQVNMAIAVGPDEGFAESIDSVGGIDSVGPVVARALPMTQKSVEASGITVSEMADQPEAADDLYNWGMLWGINRVHAPQAWGNGNTGTHQTVVAIIDTGVASNHPDLAPNLVHEACYVAAGSDADGACIPYPTLSIHGTHVAGTVAAAFGEGRAVGVGPNLGLAAYNVFEEIPGCGTCAYSDSRWMAMLDAADRGFQVINMSLGGYGVFGGQGSNELAAYIQAEKKIADYVRKAGTTMIASSGNSGIWLNGNVVHLPSDISSNVGVAATGIQPVPMYPYEGSYDIRAFYSNYGAASTVTAPGGDCGEINDCTGSVPYYWYHFILSTGLYLNEPAGCAATASCTPAYYFMAGTSMAAPHVSGVAGLIADKYPGISPQELTAILKETADDVGNRQEFGHGLVNADRATQ